MGNRDDDSRVLQRTLIALILHKPYELVTEDDLLIRLFHQAIRALHRDSILVLDCPAFCWTLLRSRPVWTFSKGPGCWVRSSTPLTPPTLPTPPHVPCHWRRLRDQSPMAITTTTVAMPPMTTEGTVP